MEEQNKCHIQASNKQYRSDEKGSVLLTTVIILLLLTLIGIGGINTASTDLQVTRNYRIHKQNLVLAEGGINYAMAMIEDALDQNPSGRSWVEDWGVDGETWDGIYLVEDLQAEDDKYFKEGSDYDPYGHPVTNAIDVEAVENDWGDIGTLNPASADFLPDTEYLAFIQIEEGAELDKRITSAVVIARTQRNGGEVVLEKGIIYTD